MADAPQAGMQNVWDHLGKVVSSSGFRWMEHALAAAAVVTVFHIGCKEGWQGIAKRALRGARALPGVGGAINREIEQSASEAVSLLTKEETVAASVAELSKEGVDTTEVLAKLQALKALDGSGESGELCAYVYTLSAEHDRLLEEATRIFLHENALNPVVFPALRTMENDVVAMTARMLHAEDGFAGSVTSGGTESILLAVKTYRDWGRATRGITDPSIVLPETGHPAFEKAAHYFGVRVVHSAVDKDYRADIRDMRAKIDATTVCIVVSAPQYPHGIVDPIQRASDLALEADVPLHVDACFGGFALPFLEKLGCEIEPFDFRNRGVTSMSADVHKFGFAAKGASVVVYRTGELRRFQFFAYSAWPGGLFASPTVLGSRGGGPIAGAWASLVHLGESGLIQAQRVVMYTAEKLIAGINAIEGLAVVGKPALCALAFQSTDESVDILTVADLMEGADARSPPGTAWKMERQQFPASIHMTIMPAHARIVDKFLADLAACVAACRGGAKSEGAAMYGMAAKIPDPSMTESFLGAVLDQLYKQK